MTSSRRHDAGNVAHAKCDFAVSIFVSVERDMPELPHAIAHVSENRQKPSYAKASRGASYAQASGCQTCDLDIIKRLFFRHFSYIRLDSTCSASHNTLTQKLEPFEPLVPGTARVYMCGLTTYDLAHAGHARTNTTFDLLVRHLRARGLETTFVRNVTDVDDKIMRRAKENGEEPLALSARMSALADEDLAGDRLRASPITSRASPRTSSTSSNSSRH